MGECSCMVYSVSGTLLSAGCISSAKYHTIAKSNATETL